MALNGLISVPSEGSNKLPSEVSDELASIQDAGELTIVIVVLHTQSFILHKYTNQN